MHCEKCDRVFPLACRRNHHLTCLPKTRGYASDEKIIRGEGRETLGAVRGDWAVAWPRQSASLGPTVGLNSMALVAGPAELLAYVRCPLHPVLIATAGGGGSGAPWGAASFAPAVHGKARGSRGARRTADANAPQDSRE